MSVELFTAAELADLRALAMSALPDEGRIVRGGLGGVVNDDGTYTPNVGVVVFTGAMRLRAATAQDSDVVFGDTEVSTSRLVVVLPWDAPPIAVDDVVRVDVSSDPNIVDRSFRVRVVTYRSYLTDRRLGVEIVE